MSTHDNATRTGASANRTFGYLFGAVYLLVGAVGFFITRGVEFAATEGKDLIVFELNPLHNVVHLGVGALLVAGAAAGAAAARKTNILVGVTYLAVGIAGLFLAGDNNESNILAINQPDNALHFATALLALGVGLLADRDRHEVSGSSTTMSSSRGSRQRI